jgi:DnaJ-class molecular chaperone
MSKKITCPHCDGKGKIIGWHEEGSSITRWDGCPLCGGTGKIINVNMTTCEEDEAEEKP